MRLIATHPFVMILVALLIGAAFSYLRYSRLFKQTESRKVVLWLAFFRGFAVFLIALLLFSPWLVRQTEQIKPPIVVLLQDNSSSLIQSSDGEKIKKDWPAIREKFAAAFGNNAKVEMLDFSDRLYDSISNTYSGKSTALDQPLADVFERYADANLGAVVLMSDGIYNRGSHPMLEASRLRVPIYGLLAGDTVAIKDLAVGAIRSNEVVFVGNQFNVEFGIKEEGFGQGINTNYFLEEITSNGSKRLKSESILAKGYRKLSTLLTAESKGIHHYRIVVEGVKGERNLSNNQRDFYVEVVDTKSRILIWAQAPHPDLAAIRQALANNPQYEIETVFSFGNRPDFQPYSLIITHNIPTSQEQRALLKPLLDSGKSVWFLGSKINFSLLNGLQPIFKALPNGVIPQYVNARPASTFYSFGLPASLLPILNDLPPLESPDLAFPGNNALDVALLQQIGQVATPYPLLAFGSSASCRMGFLIGEGIWRWRMSVFERNNNHEAFDELIKKSVQYLLVREDKRPLRVWTDKNLYETTEEIQFAGRLLNQSLEPVLNAEIKLTVTSSDKVKYQFKLLPDQQGYSLSIGSLPKGNYQWTASTTLGKEAFNSSGAFEVKETDWEGLEITARHDVLKQLAQATGGVTTPWTKAEAMADSIKKSPLFKPVYLTETDSSPLAQWWPLLLLIGMLLSVEWLVARYYGLDQ